MPSWLNTVKDILNKLNGYNQASDSQQKIQHKTVQVDTMATDKRSDKYLTFERFNGIEYDSTHLWFCTLQGAPAPFDKWFPAQTCTEPSKGVSMSTMSFGIEEVNTLNAYNVPNLRVEVIDNDKGVLEKYFKDWQKKISADNYYGFKYLEDTLKVFTIEKYTWQKDKVYTMEYYVLPQGEITHEHSNDPSLKILNINFATFGSKKI